MKKFGHARISQKTGQPWRRVCAGCELHEMRVTVACRQLDYAKPVAMWVEPHRLGIDGNDRPEVCALRNVAAIKSMGHPGLRTIAPSPSRGGAQEKTRTSTSFRPLEPESSA